MNAQRIELAVDAITVKKRVRANDGDLETLAASIRKAGLLAPIVVDRNNTLITGGRRLAACRLAGLNPVPVLKVDVLWSSMEALDIQSDENLCRLPLSADELETLIHQKKAMIGGKSGAAGPGMLTRLKSWFRRG